MSVIRQRIFASGTSLVFPQPTLPHSLIVVAVSWVETLPASDFLEFYDNTTTNRPFNTNTTDDGGNHYCPVNGGRNTFGTRIMSCLEASVCQTITLAPHRWHAATDDGAYVPASFRARAYEVIGAPGPLSGILPQGNTNVQWENCLCGNGCAGDGYGTADIDQSPSANPSESVLASDWSDMSGSKAFMIAVLAPGDDDGTGFSGSPVSVVASPWILDDVQGLTAIALLDTGDADIDQTATFTWGYNNNGASLWEISIAAWEVITALSSGNIVVTKATVPFEDGNNYTFRPNWEAPFTLIDGDSHDSGPLAPGVYSVTEDPTAGVLTTVVVSNGDPASAINLAPGETVTVAFTNSTTAPAPPGGTSFVKRSSAPPGTIQVVPLDNSPNQVWGVTVKVDDQSIPLRITLRYNELAKYWIATIKDKKGNVLLDSLPFITGTGISQNLLGQFVHLALGSATVFNASSIAADKPNNQNLGKDFLLIWGDTPVAESDVVTRLVVPTVFPPGGETPPPPPPPPPPLPPPPPPPLPGDVDVLDYCVNSQRATMHLNGSDIRGNPANSYSLLDPPTHSFAFIKSAAGWADDILLYYADRIEQFITEMDDPDHRLWSNNRAYKKLLKSLPIMPRFITPGGAPVTFTLPKPNQYQRLINCAVIDIKDKGDVVNITHPPVIMNLDSWGAGGGNIGPVSVILNQRYSGKFAREQFYLGLNLGLMYWDAASLTSGPMFTGTYAVSNWSAHNKLVAGGGVGSSFGCGYGIGWP